MNFFTRAVRSYSTNKPFLLLIIALATIFLYSPAFFYFFQPGDHYRYFLQTRNLSFPELVMNRVSDEIGRGDMLVYRPLTMSLMGLQMYLFGTRYVLWLMTGIILHLCVVFMLYKIMMRIKDTIFAYLLAFLFSINSMFIHTVVRAHFNSYILYLILVLLSLYNLYICTYKSDKRNNLIWYTFIYMIPACYIYETGTVFCALFILYLMAYDLYGEKVVRLTSLRYFILIIPALIYSLSYYVEKVARMDWAIAFEAGRVFSFQNIFETVKFLPLIFFEWITRGTVGNPSPLKYIVLIAAICYLLMCSYLSRKWLKKHLMFILLLGSMIIVHLVFNCFYRMGAYGMSYIRGGNHPIYMFWPYLLILVYLMVDFEGLKRYYRPMWNICLIGILFFILINGYTTYKSTKILARGAKGVRSYVDQLYQFVKSNKAESDFSFYVAAPSAWNDTFPVGYIDPKGEMKMKYEYRQFSVPEIFFGEYYNKSNPKYLLRYDEKKNHIQFPSNQI